MGKHSRLMIPVGYSHFCWRDNDEIVCWGAIKNPFNTLRKYKTLQNISLNL